VARLLLGVSGGIAAYKALELVRLATAAGHAVRVVQTANAQRFVGAASFEALTGAPVLVDDLEPDPLRGAFPGDPPRAHAPISHLELVRTADVLAVVPATAHTLARLAHGLADDLLTSAALAARCPVLVAPAMNGAMWEHPATRANLATLRERGVAVVEPGEGRLASKGEWGAGRLAEPAEVLRAIEALLPPEGPRPPGTTHSSNGAHAASDAWSALKLLVTAGGTREPIDAVRYIGNRSSGRMGFALAEVAAGLGADVTVVAANVELARDPRVTYVDVRTAEELRAACLEHWPGADVLLMAAAVVDFRPAHPVGHKLKKTGERELRVDLELTPDVLAELAAHRRPGQTVVGFAAETGEDALAYGREKLARKRLDAIVVNDVARPGIGFDAADNEVVVLTAEDEVRVPRAPKPVVARAILDAVVALRARAVPEVPAS